MMDKQSRPSGRMLLAAVFLAAGTAATVAFYGALPRGAGTSPLMALFFALCACTCLTAALFIWRRSRFAGHGFLSAVALLLFPARYLFPGQDIFVPAFLVVLVIGFIGYRCLQPSNSAAT